MSIDGVRLRDTSVNFILPDRKVRPLRDQLIVKPIGPTLSSTALTATWGGEPVAGVVIAAGPGCYPNIHERGVRDGKPYRTVRQSKQFRKTEVKVGDIVHLGGMEIGGYLWPRVWAQGEWCVICREADVAVLEEKDAANITPENARDDVQERTETAAAKPQRNRVAQSSARILSQSARRRFRQARTTRD
jgi:hypothetical protein